MRATSSSSSSWSGRIVDRAKGTISWDADGSGAKAQVLIATFKNEKKAGIIDASDFFFV
jgi:hypothetical protein